METTTADEVLNNAAVELGLLGANLTNPFSSTDQNIVLLVRLLRRLGRQLVRARDWSHLTREYTFPTVASTASYALPTGFLRMKDQTHWNRDTSAPLGGPAGPVGWQEMNATTSAGPIVRPFRIFGNKLHLYPTPTEAEDIYYEYITSYWVVPDGQAVPTASTTTAITDTLWFDETLLVAGLRLAYLKAKGFDSTAAQLEFNDAWDAATSGDGVAPVLNLSGAQGFRLIDTRNLPDTGYGS